MWYRAFSKIYKEAAENMVADCKDFIEKGSQILDLGCGSAIIAKAFESFFDAKITGVDIVDRRVFPIPFEIIDGKHLPFKDNSFDIVFIAYVLHHSIEPIELLKEARRVTRDKIIIYEDLKEGILSQLFCKIHAVSFDAMFNKNKRKTVSFKSEKQWLDVFRNLDFELVFKKRVSLFLNPIDKKLFVLTRNNTDNYYFFCISG